MNELIKKYLSKIGKKGGECGKGDSKRRSKDHYKKMNEAKKTKKRNRNRI